jgi:glycosyltransferase involved in cell wall biosynthesis
MHIAVIPHTAPSNGGAYQYSLAVLEALATLPSGRGQDQFTLLVRSGREIEYLNNYGSQWSLARFPFFTRERLVDMIETSVGGGWLRDAATRAAYRLAPAAVTNPDRIWSSKTVYRFLRQRGVDWALYTTPNAQSFEIGLPYVMPVYDLQHRLQPEFLEVSAHGIWEHREYLYRNGTRRATLILADSDVGKEDILHYYGPYGVTPDRVKVLPYVPAPYLSRDVSQQERTLVRDIYRLPERYLFYPAQLWPHKNHVRLVQAMGLLKEEQGTEIHLVLCGTYSGVIRRRVFQEMMREADRLRIAHQIHYLGYIPNDAMSALYAEARGLVMPTFFGPTNIPIVEAWLFGCPVLTSDIRGIREQVGDAGLLVDPKSVEAIAEGMRRLWEDEGLRADLAQRGTQRLAKHSQQDFCAKLEEIIAETNLRIREQRSLGDRLKVSP